MEPKKGLPLGSASIGGRGSEALHRLVGPKAILTWSSNINDACIYFHPDATSSAGHFEKLDLQELVQFIHPDDLQQVSSLFQNVKTNRGGFHLEYRVINSDGSVNWLMTTGAPRYSDLGQFCGYTGITVDVTRRHQAQSLYAKRGARLNRLFQYASEIICHCTPDGVIQDVAPSATRMLGYEPSELVGQNLDKLLHPDDSEVLRAKICSLAKNGGASNTVECRSSTRHGSYVWMRARIRVLLDEVSREHIGTILVLAELAFEGRPWHQLQLREERYRRLMYLSSDWYWETDGDGHFAFISEGVEERTGIPVESVLGKTREEGIVDRNQPGYHEYQEKVARRQAFKDVQLEIAWRGPGSERFVRISGEPVFENGVFKGYRGASRDITKKVELAKQVQKLAAANKALIEYSLDMLVLFDDEGRFLHTNPAAKAITGYEPEQLVGRHYLDFVAAEDREKAEHFASQLSATDVPVRNIELRWLRRDGSIVYLDWSVRYLEEHKHAYAIGRDVTERHHSKVKLEQANEKLTTLLETMGEAFFSLDREWRITYANNKAANVVNCRQEELIGRVIWDAAPQVLDSPFFAHYGEALETGKPAVILDYHAPLQAWLEVRAYPHEHGLSVFFRDVSEQHKTEAAYRRSQQRVHDIIEMTPAGYVFADANLTITDVNPALCTMSGYSQDELVGRNLTMLLPSSSFDVNWSMERNRTNAFETILLHKQGHTIPILVNANSESDERGNPAFLTAFLTDISERKEAEEDLERLATHDALTGLSNRNFLNLRLQEMFDTAPREETNAVMFIDLDRFKEINDTMGHKAGDILLGEIARRLQLAMRPSDIVARLGGDEFVVIANCRNGAETASKIARKILELLATPMEIEGQEIYIGGSIGISMFPQDGKTKEELFQKADTAMYQAKAAGRNDYRFFTEEMSSEAKTRLVLENGLRRAAKRNEFTLHYQPRIDLMTMEFTGMEALIRWHHPQLGAVSPARFIPAAEDLGLIDGIGMWVLEQACKDALSLMNIVGCPLNLAVNLSARQLRSKALPAQVAAILDNTGFPSHLLELEMSEAALVQDMGASISMLNELKQQGISMSVDDYGTGRAGLVYLKRYPIDILKLDGSFVIEQQAEMIDYCQFLNAVIELAHTLNLKVVAEGIETPHALSILQHTHCDEAQGYLFARPMPIDELKTFMSQARM